MGFLLQIAHYKQRVQGKAVLILIRNTANHLFDYHFQK